MIAFLKSAKNKSTTKTCICPFRPSKNKKMRSNHVLTEGYSTQQKLPKKKYTLKNKPPKMGKDEKILKI